jgi:hypothetical protein
VSDLSHRGGSAAAGSSLRRAELLPVPSDGIEQTLYTPDELAPRLRLGGLSIDGFGALSNVTVQPFAAGMTILLGPNEAGKSTIFDFMTAVLFGFPTRRSARFREPVNGGRHGGRVSLLDSSGNEWIVERHSSPSKRFTVTKPDGSPGGEPDLVELLGHASGELFRAVFAVDLDDLNRLDGMSSDEVREVLFSSSILGQRRSAARALKELDSRREKLVKPRQGGEANVLWAELLSLRVALADARAASSRFASLQAEARRAQAEVAEMRERRERVRSRARELDLLLQCWDVLSDRDALQRDLDVAPQLSDGDRAVLVVTEQVRTVARQLSGHLERTRSCRQLRSQVAALTQSIESKVAEIGGGWSLEVAAAPGFDAEALRAAIQPQLSKLAQARAELKAARHAVASARSRLAGVASEPSPWAGAGDGSWAAGAGPDRGSGSVDGAPRGPSSLPDERTLRLRIAGLTELRACVVQLNEVRGRVRQAEELEESRRAAAAAAAAAASAAAAAAATVAARDVSAAPGARAVRALTAMVVVTALALAVGAALLLARRQPVAGALLTLLAVAVAVLGAWVRRGLVSPPRGSAESGGGATDGHRSVGTSGDAAAIDRGAIDGGESDPAGTHVIASTSLARYRQEEEALETEGLALLAGLGLGLGLESDLNELSTARVQHRIDEAEVELELRRAVDAWHQRRLDAEAVLDEAVEAERAAERALTLVEHEITGIAARAGLPELDPQDVFAVLDRLAQLADRLLARQRIVDNLPYVEQEVAAYEATVVRLARALGVGADVDSGGGQVAAGSGPVLDLDLDAYADLGADLDLDPGLDPDPDLGADLDLDLDLGLDPDPELDLGLDASTVSAAPLPDEVIEELVSVMLARSAAVEERAAIRADLERRLAETNRSLDRTLGHGEQSDALRRELGTGLVLDWELERERCGNEIEQLESRHEDAVRTHEGLQRQVDDLARSADVPALEQHCAELEEAVREVVRRYVITSGARLLVQRTLRQYEERRQPLVLERAGRHFARVTNGRYVRLGVDAAADGSKASVRVIRSDGRAIDAADLSRGTTEQLYLCIRLGLAETFADRYVPLPIVLDDVLVNFDPVRQEAMASELAASAGSHQVIFLTCHPHVAELLERACDGIDRRVIKLEADGALASRIGAVGPVR